MTLQVKEVVRILLVLAGLEMNPNMVTKRAPKEVWLVPAQETRNPWDFDYITKEMFVNVLELKLTVKLKSDNDILIQEPNMEET
jgi:hypothetical protein